jgi:hypothetical protein
MNDMSDTPVAANTTDTPILVPDSPPESEGPTPEEFCKAKILELFEVYPVMNETMLQAALGPSLSPKIWRPEYSKLLASKVLEKYEVSAKDHVARSRPYQCVRLFQVS